MGFMDLSSSVASKKTVEFNDARYQLCDRLKQNTSKKMRSTFTLYDSRDVNKVSVQDISAAYELSDKHMPIGEILNKMVDLIVELEDGILSTEKDAAYVWKYSTILTNILDDKLKRQESLSAFDNSLKNSVINSQSFIARYPGKYTTRTNFFDPKVKTGLIADVTKLFKDETVPKIYETAITQSKAVAEKHNNTILDKIVRWAIENYKCEVDSFFKVEEDEKTKLFYSTNTIILHLRNGYDMSIIGYTGTNHDDKFAISIFNGRNMNVENHGEGVTQQDIQDSLTKASSENSVDPLTKLLRIEKEKNAVLKKQYAILSETRPMIPAAALAIPAAESVVGKDYIWGCQQFRKTHDELPTNFKYEDIVLPELPQEAPPEATKVRDELLYDLNGVASKMENTRVQGSQIESDINQVIHSTTEEVPARISNPANAELDKPETVNNANLTLPQTNPLEQVEDIGSETNEQTEDVTKQSLTPDNKESDPESIVLPDDLFKTGVQKETEPLPSPQKQSREFEMPVLAVIPEPEKPKINIPNPMPKKVEEFDMSATILPGAIIEKPKEEEPKESATIDAQPVPERTPSLWKENPNQKVENVSFPDVVAAEGSVSRGTTAEIQLDDLDSLFA